MLGIIVTSNGIQSNEGQSQYDAFAEPNIITIPFNQKSVSLPDQANTRVISFSTSNESISKIESKGCKIIHKLSDFVSYVCPASIVSSLDDVRKERIFFTQDIYADRQINADDVWNHPTLPLTGQGVKVAVLDTGIYHHSELTNDIADTIVFKNPASDRDGHGTHVSGTITATGQDISHSNPFSNPANAKGVAPDAKIMMAKVCGNFGCFESDIAAGIDWAVNNGAQVISMSLGSLELYSGDCDSDFLAIESNKAVDAGVVVIAASGNDGESNGISSPGCASKVISVGAVDSNSQVASFSNSSPSLDIVAPGVDIFSTYSCDAINGVSGDCWAWLSGTSMATPHIAGVASLILEKNPKATVDDVKLALYSTAIDVGLGDGNGMVNALGAVNAISPSNLDIIAPAISDVEVSDITTSKATITWTTDEPSTSQVDYGLSDSYGSIISDSSLVTSHNIELGSLLSSTTYHFSITSGDETGNSASSDDDTFTTSTDNDGSDKIGSYQPSTSSFYLRNADSSITHIPGFGLAGDSIPIVGDWDGN